MSKKHSDDTSPVKLLIEELDSVRKIFAQLSKSYVAKVNAELEAVSQAVSARGSAEQLSKDQLRDLREMLSIARDLKIKPDKARRRDFKKIESVIEELQEFSKNW